MRACMRILSFFILFSQSLEALDGQNRKKLFLSSLCYFAKYDFASLEEINNQYNLFKDTQEMINCENEKKINLLMYAIVNHNIELVKELLANNVNLDLKDNYGQTALDYSICYHKGDLMTELVLNNNPDISKVKFLSILELYNLLVAKKRIIIDKKIIKNRFYNRLLYRYLTSQIVRKWQIDELGKFLQIGFNPYTKDKDNRTYIDHMIGNKYSKYQDLITYYENKLENKFYQKIKNIGIEWDRHSMINMAFLPDIWSNIFLYWDIKEFLKIITTCQGLFKFRYNISILKQVLKNTDDELRYYFMQVES